MKFQTSVRWAGGLCLLWCLLPGLLFYIPDRGRLEFIREVEKREPAVWPELKFPQSFFARETYRRLADVMRDALPFRGYAIVAKNRLMRSFFGETRFGDVQIGKKGWLYLDGMYSRPYEDETVTRRVLTMLQYAADHPPRGCDLRFIIAPDKDTIVPEYMNDRSRALAARDTRRRDLIHNFCSDRPDRKVIGLWREYREARRMSREPIFYRLDTHHTSFAASALLCRAMVDLFAPGLWDVRELKFLGTKPKPADLAMLAGLGTLDDVQRTFALTRPEVTRVAKTVDSPARGWRSPAHYISRSRTQQMIPGRTLILHDSYLAENRDALSRFFEDVTFQHYDDIIAQGDPAAFFGKYDRVVVEVVERQSISILGLLLPQLNARQALDVPLPLLANVNSSEAGFTPVAGGGLKITVTGDDPAVKVPALKLPPGHHYGVRIMMESDRKTNAQLMYLTRSGEGYDDARGSWKEVQPGLNSLWFEVTSAQTQFPLRFDPSYLPGTYTIQSVRIYDVVPSGLDAYENARLTLQGAARAEMPVLFESRTGGLSTAPTALAYVSDDSREVKFLVDSQGASLQIQGTDPQIMLPAPLVEKGARPRLRAEYEPPSPTECQLFYRETAGQPFSEARSIRRNIGPGVARLDFPLKPAWLEHGLRFDPGCVSGTYRFSQLALQGVKLDKALGAALRGPGTLWLVYPSSRALDITPALEVQDAVSTVQHTPQGGGYILFTEKNPNPTWTWPVIQPLSPALQLVKVYLEAPAKARCRLGAASGTLSAGSKPDAQTRFLSPGRNVLVFAASKQDLAAGLRLELETKPQLYRLYGVELHTALRPPADSGLGRYDYTSLSSEALGAYFTFGTRESLYCLNSTQPGPIMGNAQTQVRLERWGWSVTAQGTDPVLYLPGVTATPGAMYLARLIIAAPEPTACQLFFRPERIPGYGEAFSERRFLAKGVNVVYFYLEARDLAKPLRLDPGEKAGRYSVYDWQIRRLAAP